MKPDKDNVPDKELHNEQPDSDDHNNDQDNLVNNDEQIAAENEDWIEEDELQKNALRGDEIYVKENK